jgi:septum formation protein
LLAWRKADAACVLTPDSVIIGADTIVVLDGDVLNKPLDAGEARQMLRRLSGRTHRVYTGLAAIVRAPGTGTQGGGRLALDLVASDVTLDTLDDQAIEAYVSTGEPLDKAGAYGIQGLGGRLVRQVLGSYTNVVGLPLAAVHALLAGAGFAQLVDPCEAYQRWLHTQGKEPLPCPPTFP